MGILSVLLLCAALPTIGITLFLGIPLGIAAIVCGIIGKSKTPHGMPSGMAIAGIVLGAIGILGGGIAAVFGIALLAELGNDPEFMYLLDELSRY